MLINPKSLKEKLSHKNTILLCCLLKPVNSLQPAMDTPEFISGSKIFDVDDFSVSGSAFPHTLLSLKDFEKKARDLGIDDDSSIFIYDCVGIYSSPRVWFNFTLMGCKNVSVLDGGLPGWKNNGFPVFKTFENVTTFGSFTAHQISNMLASKEEVLNATINPNCVVIDVRSSDRFFGKVPEPRQGLRSGHIPGSINIPFSQFIDGISFRSKKDLMNIFKEAGCDENKELIFSCGSGVTACIGYFAANLCGYKNTKLYDGSWAEWGSIGS
ncbi:MAG: sulfurtransferase [Candidatus Riflebacteria bacterium]|nr:sulfurtransferase [Candidatus Riflebacteria bacterium]